MSMHLERPWLSTTGKKKGKQKFASAEHARKARELAESWKAFEKKWKINAKSALISAVDCTNLISAVSTSSMNPVVTKLYVRETAKIASLPFTGGPCPKPADKVYTGTMIKGIGTMHKSNAIPIFSNEEAQDIARMRR
jgi:hypothetical protein